MPYGLNYQPSAYVINDAARAIGLEEFYRQERELALREQRMADDAFGRQQFADERALAPQLPTGPRLYPGAYQDPQIGEKAVLGFLGGQMNFDRQLELQGNEIAADQAQQEAIAQREEMRQQSQLERERQAQLARQLDAEWQAILEHRDELTPEQFADVQDQVRRKFEALSMPPPVAFPGGEEQSEGQKRLADYQQRYPSLPWVMGKDGEPELPRGFNLEMDENYRQEKQRFEIEKAEAVEQTKIRVQQQAAEAKEKQEEAKAARDALKSYAAAVTDVRNDKKWFMVKKPGTGANAASTVEEYDKEAHEQEIRRTEAMMAGFFGIPREQRMNLDATPESASPSPSGLIQISTPEEWAALRPGTRYVAPDGSVRTKQ